MDDKFALGDWQTKVTDLATYGVGPACQIISMSSLLQTIIEMIKAL